MGKERYTADPGIFQLSVCIEFKLENNKIQETHSCSKGRIQFAAVLPFRLHSYLPWHQNKSCTIHMKINFLVCPFTWRLIGKKKNTCHDTSVMHRIQN
jgi:hypothetical protein